MFPDGRPNYHWYCADEIGCGHKEDEHVPEIDEIPHPGQKNCPKCDKEMKGYPIRVQGPPRHPLAKY